MRQLPIADCGLRRAQARRLRIGATAIFVVALALGLFPAPLAVEAQQASRVYRIGFLGATSPSGYAPQVEAFRGGLRDLGYVEGKNVVIEFRWADGKYARLPELAAELVLLKPDVLVTHAPAGTLAAKRATATIPIVMGVVGDAVATGLVAGLARPGGNVTGSSVMAPDLVGKQVEMLKEVIPKLSRVALLGNPTNASHPPQVRQAQNAARALGMRLQPVDARGPDENDRAFAVMTSERAGAVIVFVDAMLIDYRRRIADLATRSRLPAVYALSDHTEAGGLMAYGTSVRDRFRRAASYVDKILKGAKPGALPVEQPTTFELVINLKTAKALGLTIPQSVLIRADEVIR